MTTKEWLNRGRNLNEEINALIKAKEKALYDACNVSIAYDKERVQTSQNNSTETKLTRFADYSKAIDERIDELYKIKQEILKAISGVDNSTYRTLLIERYINFKTWERIAVDINYDYYHVIKHLHPKALKAINIPHNTTS